MLTSMDIGSWAFLWAFQISVPKQWDLLVGKVDKLLPECHPVRTQGLVFTGNFWLVTAGHTWWWRQNVNNPHKEHVFMADRNCFGKENMAQNYEIQECVQAQDELFDSWWNRAKAKAVEGTLGKMSKDDKSVRNSLGSSGDLSDLDVVVVKVKRPLIDLVYQLEEEMWRQRERPRVLSEIGRPPTVAEFTQPVAGAVSFTKPEPDPGDLGDTKKPAVIIHLVLDLVHFDRCGPFLAQEVNGTLVPCTATCFAVFKNGGGDRNIPLDTTRYQMFIMGWGLCRVRTLEGEVLIQTLGGAVDPAPPDVPNLPKSPRVDLSPTETRFYDPIVKSVSWSPNLT